MYDCPIGLNRKATNACGVSDANEWGQEMRNGPQTYDCDTDLGVFIVHGYSPKRVYPRTSAKSHFAFRLRLRSFTFDQ